MSECLFSYGTLQQEKTQLDLFGRLLRGDKDVLKGYKISMIEITDKSFLARGENNYQRTLVATMEKNDSVEGTAFEISEEELFLADKYEPIGYKRIRAVLQSGKEAWIYLVL